MSEKLKADTTNNYAYNKKLQPLANKLRKEMTKAEACLWKYALCAGRVKGYQFRRQRPVLRYIADFLCKELRLVIEVDGVTHQCGETGEKDKRKTSDLERAGFKVIRFTDEEVLKNMNGVMESIERVVEEKEMSGPPPAPPPAGDKQVRGKTNSSEGGGQLHTHGQEPSPDGDWNVYNGVQVSGRQQELAPTEAVGFLRYFYPDTHLY